MDAPAGRVDADADIVPDFYRSTAEVVRAHPGWFGFFATSALPDVEGALARRSEEGKRLDS